MKGATTRMGLFLVGSGHFASPVFAVPLGSLEACLARSSQIVADTRSADSMSRRTAGAEILALLQLHAHGNPDVATVVGMLDLALEQQQLQDQNFKQILEQLENTDGDVISSDFWIQFENELNVRINHLLRGLQIRALYTRDAERLLDVARYAARASAEGRDFDSVQDQSSTRLRMFELLHGIAEGTRGLNDPLTCDLLESFRETLREISNKRLGTGCKNPIAMFEIPAAVLEAMSDHTQRGWDAAAEALSHLRQALDNDPQAILRMIGAGRRMDEVLSSRAYSRSIWNALTDSLLVRLPFARLLSEWY